MGNKHAIQTEHCNTTNELPPDVPKQNMWMSIIEDVVPFTMLSIPGTHCSCSVYLRSPNWRHQSLDISHSLKAGIRYFDVQIRLEKENKLRLWQDSYPIEKDFASLLEPLVYFLTINNLEVITVCLTEAYEPESERNFSDVIYREIEENVPSKNIWIYNEVPETLGDARGKIIFLRNYSDGKARFVPFQNCVSSNRTGLTTDCKAFWDKQRKSLINTIDQEDLALHITYLSHKDLYHGAAYVINKRLFDLVCDNSTRVRLGIIAMDFPGSLLVKNIIQTNFCRKTHMAGGNRIRAIEWKPFEK